MTNPAPWQLWCPSVNQYLIVVAQVVLPLADYTISIAFASSQITSLTDVSNLTQHFSYSLLSEEMNLAIFLMCHTKLYLFVSVAEPSQDTALLQHSVSRKIAVELLHHWCSSILNLSITLIKVLNFNSPKKSSFHMSTESMFQLYSDLELCATL